MTKIHSPIEDHSQHVHFMQLAIQEAQAAADENEVPVGAVIVCGDGQVIASDHNRREQLRDPTAHAEMLAITQAANALGAWRLENCTLYSTLEPCPMCAGAIVGARIPLVVYGAADPKSGAVHSMFNLLHDPRLNHQCSVISGILAEQCGNLLVRFFQKQRDLGKK